jgi:hypothetical protein
MESINFLKLSGTIKSLHTSGIYVREPISSIGSSKHINDYRFDKSNSVLMHLGFSFRLQSGNEFEIYYDLVNNITVRQRRYENIPLILGLVCYFEGQHINRYDLKIIKKIDLPNCVGHVCDVSSQEELTKTGDFEIVDDTKVFTVSSLTKTYPEPVYYYDNNFFTSKEYNQIRAEEELDRRSWEDARREIDSWDKDFPGWQGDR